MFSSNLQKILDVLLLFFALLCGGHSLFLIYTASVAQIQVNLVLQLFLVVLFVVWTSNKTGSYLNAPAIFVVVIFFWHSAFLLCYFFQVAEIFQYTGRVFAYGEAYVHKAVALIALCISCSVGGTLVAYFRTFRPGLDHGKSRQGGTFSARKIAFYPSRISAQVIAALFAAYILFTLFYLFKEGMRGFGQIYSEELYLYDSGSWIGRFYQSTKFFSLIFIIAAAGYATKVRARHLAIAVMFLAFVQILMGSRSMPFLTIIALVVSIDHFYKRLSGVIIAAFLVVLAALSHIINVTRSFLGIGMNIFNFYSTGQSVDLWHFIWDAQQSGLVLRTMQFISDRGSFFYGQSLIDAVIYLVPRFIVDGMGFRTGFTAPSEWIIQNSQDVAIGGGLGYSLVAESYFNFGMFGCLLFFVIGWFIAKNYFKYVFFRDKYALLHSLNVAGILSLHMRNDFGTYFRYLFYGFILVELLRSLDRKAFNRRTSAARISLREDSSLAAGRES